MRTRIEIEKLEDQILAPYAMKSSQSAGRQFEQAQHEWRTCYQRDRDRIVHTEAFRKLEYKTQVFVIFEGDYYRTRLTHTIEVAQIARTIGRTLQLNEDLIEAVALAHDLGHPPFGHAGEDALDEILKSEDGDYTFNHNFRSFEIVTQEKRYPEFDGLNLTEEVLIGILKHSTLYDIAGDVGTYKKKGASLEARVVDVADSLAYLSHDIDDGLTSGCIVEEDLTGNELWDQAYAVVKAMPGINDANMRKYQIVKALIDIQIKDLLKFTSDNLNRLKFSSSQEVKDHHIENPGDVIVGFSPEISETRNALQSLLNKKLYHHFRVERMTDKAKRVIRDLFDVYKKNPNQLPYSVYFRDQIYTSSEINLMICNYIASMTDRYALDEHKKLFNPYQKV